MQPMVNLQYAMSSDYLPWGTNDLAFDVNSGLMAVPGLTMDTFTPPMPQPPPNPYQPSPMSQPSPNPYRSSPISQPPSDPYRLSPPQEIYQAPMHTPPPPPVAIPPQPQIQLSGPPPPPVSSLPRRTDDGPQIRMNEYVMRPNLSHSRPVTTTPFKKYKSCLTFCLSLFYH